MNAMAFDTHAHVKRLVGAGLTESQAEAVIEAVRQTTELPDISHLATKADLQAAVTDLKNDTALLRAELKQDISELRSELKQDISELRSELKQDISELRAELKQDIGAVRGEMKGLRGELIWWIIGAASISSLVHYFIK